MKQIAIFLAFLSPFFAVLKFVGGFDIPLAVVLAPIKIAGISGRQEWDFEIADASRIPREYLMIDETKIRRVIKALGSEANIPGVRAFQKTVMSVRAKR